MFIYNGMRDEIGANVLVARATENGDLRAGKAKPLPLAPSLKIRNHSPNGFEWGYGGSGPAQLALAILLHHFSRGSGRPTKKDKELAGDYHQMFKLKIVAKLPVKGWRLTSEEIENTIEKMMGEYFTEVQVEAELDRKRELQEEP